MFFKGGVKLESKDLKVVLNSIMGIPHFKVGDTLSLVKQPSHSGL